MIPFFDSIVLYRICVALKLLYQGIENNVVLLLDHIKGHRSLENSCNIRGIGLSMPIGGDQATPLIWKIMLFPHENVFLPCFFHVGNFYSFEVVDRWQ